MLTVWAVSGIDALTLCEALRIIAIALDAGRRLQDRTSLPQLKSLGALVDCFHRYVETNPGRYHVLETAMQGRLIKTTVIRANEETRE